MVMSDDGDVDVESAEDVPEIGGEATATTANGARLYVSVAELRGNPL